MNDRDCWTCDAMEEFGGSFIKALANLARHADPINLEYIKTTWANNWAEYEAKGREVEKHVDTAYDNIKSRG